MNGERERVQGNKKSSIKEDPFRSRRHIGRTVVGESSRRRGKERGMEKGRSEIPRIGMVGEIFSVEGIMESYARLKEPLAIISDMIFHCAVLFHPL